jgi:hypothetical protein
MRSKIMQCLVKKNTTHKEWKQQLRSGFWVVNATEMRKSPMFEIKESDDSDRRKNKSMITFV